VEANTYALSRLAWEPQADPYLVARDWAHLRFGPRAAPYMARLLMLSPQAVLRAFYIGPAAPRQGSWAPNGLWVRDDEIYGGDRVAELYGLSRDELDFRIAMAEKAEAEALVAAMKRELARALPWIEDTALAEYARHSLAYEETLVQTLHHYLAGMFHYYRWAEGDGSARIQALAHLRQWQEAWGRHQKVTEAGKAASPFQDRGMVAAVTGALRALERKALPP